MSAPLDVEGPAAPPRCNGELVFAEPWESRAFAMAVALYETGVVTWPQFRSALIARIAAWEALADGNKSWSYYHHWLDALQDVLDSNAAVPATELTARAAALAERSAGADHPHPHPRVSGLGQQHT